MGSTMVLSLVILAFLIFMVIVLMYINYAAKEEIKKVQLQMLVRFSAALCREMYRFEEYKREDKVDKAIKVFDDIVEDWNLDVDYNQFEIKSKLRKKV